MLAEEESQTHTTARGCSKVRALMPRLGYLFLALLSAACQPSGKLLHVEDAHIVLPPPGAPMAAAYLTIVNPESKDYELIAVESEAYETVEIHESAETHGMSRMRKLDSAKVSARGRLSFAPGGKHLMLFEPKTSVADQAQVPMTLKFRKSDGSTTEVVAKFQAGAAGHGEHVH